MAPKRRIHARRDLAARARVPSPPHVRARTPPPPTHIAMAEAAAATNPVASMTDLPNLALAATDPPLAEQGYELTRMEGAGKRTETGTEATSISRLSNDNITDILRRLPAKSVLCAGAVCKAWRCITTNTRFLTEHARLQPPNVAKYTYTFSPRWRCKDNRPGYFEHALALDLLPIISSSSDDDDDDEAARRCLIRYPNHEEVTFLLLASCNGVLLFHKSWELQTSAISGYTFLLCNPTTRRWAEFPRLPPARQPTDDIVEDYAFYYHEPSGEYRLLLRRQRRSWFILSTGAAKPRKVHLHARLPETMGITKLLTATPVALEGRLHWPPRQAAGAPAAAGAGESETGTSTTMAVFDTLSETFHLMAGPPTTTADQTKVFDMEGRLVVADFGDEEHVDLWFLEDYSAGRWERRHRAPTPWHTQMPGPAERRPKCVAAGDGREGAVMLGNHQGMLVYNLRTRTARTVGSVAASNHTIVMSWHVFRENLERHPSFAARSAAELGVNFFWY